MFILTSQSLESLPLKDDLKNEHVGAFCSFEGLVRLKNDNKEVMCLEYEAFDALCQSEAEKIILEAKQKFYVLKIKCYHRTGKLNLGEMAVWVGVSSVHRADAFDACRYVIDELKKRLPIWKKEYYSNGDSGWINAATFLNEATTLS